MAIREWTLYPGRATLIRRDIESILANCECPLQLTVLIWMLSYVAHGNGPQSARVILHTGTRCIWLIDIRLVCYC
jgi:hypothetical protein